jgi:glutathione S-transferase
MAHLLKLHRHALSGHCHRVETLLSLLGLPYELVEVDLLKGEQRQPAFRNKNRLGQVPVLEDGDVTLADSNAILVYLALRYDRAGTWLPREPLAAARVQRWLSISAGELVRGPGELRLHALLGTPVDRAYSERVTSTVLSLMQDALTSSAFLIGDQPTIADLAMYAYTARAPEGGVTLQEHAAVRGWHARLEGLPGFVPMQNTRPR